MLIRPSSTYPLARAIVGDQGPVMNSMAFSAASSANLGHNTIITHLELNDQLEHVLNLSPPSSSPASSLLSIQISDKPRMGIMLHLPWMIAGKSRV